MKPSARGFGRSLASLSLAALLGVVGCQSGGGGVGTIFTSGATARVQNDASVPVKVTFWAGEREPGYRQTWTNMNGRTERIDPGRRATFNLKEYADAADPFLRVHAETRGPTFEQQREAWYEVLTAPPISMSVAQEDDELILRAPDAQVTRIPEDQVLAGVDSGGESNNGG